MLTITLYLYAFRKEMLANLTIKRTSQLYTLVQIVELGGWVGGQAGRQAGRQAHKAKTLNPAWWDQKGREGRGSAWGIIENSTIWTLYTYSSNKMETQAFALCAQLQPCLPPGLC